MNLESLVATKTIHSASKAYATTNLLSKVYQVSNGKAIAYLIRRTLFLSVVVTRSTAIAPVSINTERSTEVVPKNWTGC
jgi:hypothetical protein